MGKATGKVQRGDISEFDSRNLAFELIPLHGELISYTSPKESNELVYYIRLKHRGNRIQKINMHNDLIGIENSIDELIFMIETSDDKETIAELHDILHDHNQYHELLKQIIYHWEGGQPIDDFFRAEYQSDETQSPGNERTDNPKRSDIVTKALKIYRNEKTTQILASEKAVDELCPNLEKSGDAYNKKIQNVRIGLIQRLKQINSSIR